MQLTRLTVTEGASAAGFLAIGLLAWDNGRDSAAFCWMNRAKRRGAAD
jgi:hypothetical protein